MSRGSFLQTKCDERAYKKMEEAGGITLSEAQRANIRKALEEYERARRAKPATHQLAAKAVKGLEVAITNIRAIQKFYPGVLKQLGSEFEGSTRKIPSLRLELKRYAAKRRGKPRNVFLPPLLIMLKKIFKESGGKSTGIHRGEKASKDEKQQRRSTPPRHGPFLDFAYEAVSCLPSSFRSSKEALGFQWEQISSGRSGDYMFASSPGAMSLVMTSRRIPMPKHLRP